MTIFKLPDLGEGLPDAEISAWHVKENDLVEIDQSIVSMETAKAVVEVPSPVKGRILKLFGRVGDLIKTGQPLVEFDVELADISEKAPTVAGKLKSTEQVMVEPFLKKTQNQNAPQPKTGSQLKITPAVRALAQRLKVDLTHIIGTGTNGLVTSQDVELAAKLLQGAGQFEPLKGVRRAMAQVMSHAHAEVVPVTVMEDALLLNWAQGDDITVRIILALVKAMQLEPALNAWYDGKSESRCLMKEIHLGLAMDTEEGLFVPVLKNAEKLSVSELRTKIDELKQQVASRKVLPENLRGATFTLSNFGKFAGRYANPIVVPPQVGILGVGKLREEVVAVKSEMKIAKVLPIALTVDHRAVTGGEATRFLGAVIEGLV